MGTAKKVAKFVRNPENRRTQTQRSIFQDPPARNMAQTYLSIGLGAAMWGLQTFWYPGLDDLKWHAAPILAMQATNALTAVNGSTRSLDMLIMIQLGATLLYCMFFKYNLFFLIIFVMFAQILRRMERSLGIELDDDEDFADRHRAGRGIH